MLLVDKLVVRKAPNRTTTSLRFGVYVAISRVSQVHMHVHNSLVPGPKKRRKGLVSAIRACDYDRFKHMFISRAILMTPSKSCGRLYDITVHICTAL